MLTAIGLNDLKGMKQTMCDIKKLKIRKKCSTPMEPSIVFLQLNGDVIGLCQKCWNKVADSDLEWGDSPKVTMEEVLSEKSRGIEGATLTEYKYRGKEIETKSDDGDIE